MKRNNYTWDWLHHLVDDEALFLYLSRPCLIFLVRFKLMITIIGTCCTSSKFPVKFGLNLLGLLLFLAYGWAPCLLNKF
jgi:hypothetical protein